MPRTTLSAAVLVAVLAAGAGTQAQVTPERLLNAAQRAAQLAHVLRNAT